MNHLIRGGEESEPAYCKKCEKTFESTTDCNTDDEIEEEKTRRLDDRNLNTRKHKFQVSSTFC